MSKGMGAKKRDCRRAARLLYSYLSGRVFSVLLPSVILLPLILSFLALSCAKRGPRFLRYAFSTQGVQRYRSTLTMTSSSGSETQIILEESHRVQEVSPNGTARMEVRFDTAEVHFTDPQSLAAAFLAKSLQGKVLHILVSPLGEVQSRDEAGQNPGMGGINLNQTFSQVFPTLPQSPPRPGDSWNTERTVPVPSPEMEITNHVLTQYTFQRIESRAGKECARIFIRTTAELLGKSRDAQSQETLQGRMTGEGVFYFALREGRLQLLEMKNKTEVSTQNAQGKTSKGTTEQVVKVEALP